MKNIRHEALIWLQIVVFAALWVGLIALTSSDRKLGWEAVKELPHVVTSYAVVAFIFVKWAWRWRIFSGWLVPFPDLQGTWAGTIVSTWEDAAAKKPAPIPCLLVIRQTFSSIACSVYTPDSESFSTSAGLAESEDNGVIRLTYTYSNRPRVAVRERSVIHDGAAMLTLSRGATVRLKGEYWTTRRTTGELDFQFRQRAIVGEYLDVLALPAG